MTTLWWKADRYELTDGSIRPAEGARFSRYDPMDIYDQARTQKRGHAIEAPYTALVRAVASLTWKLGPEGPRLTEDGEERLLRWVTDHGLLGLLEHETVQIVGKAYRKDLPREGQPDDWRVLHTRDRFPRPDRLTPALTMIPPLGYRDLQATCQRIDEEGMRVMSWDEVAAEHFPDDPTSTPGDWRYPLPDDPNFLARYCEPVDRFLAAANILRRASADIGSLREHAKEADVDPDSLFEAEEHAALAVSPLNGLLGAVHPAVIVESDRGIVAQKWQAPSLLGLLALQLHLDLSSEKGAFHECVKCHAWFYSTGYQAAYCSNECRQAAINKRRRGE